MRLIPIFKISREHGRVVGRLYDLGKNRCDIVSGNVPPFTHFLGLAIDPGTGSLLTRHLKTLSITVDLIEEPPRSSAFRQQLHHGVTDVLTFQAAGFETFIHFTYEIPHSDEKTIWSATGDKTRNAIRNGEKLYQITDTFDPDGFINFYRRNVKSVRLTENVDLEIAV